jgi:betaine-aldehyde dehydrogenase
VAKVSLTGSVPTGRKVLALAGSHMKQATMELGGKSPLIIFDDADVENAVGGALLANFYSTGQVCSNGTRVFVQDGIRERFLDRLVTRTKAIRIGDPLDPDTQMGPLINAQQHEKVIGYIEIGKAEGATLACGGGVPRLQGLEGGFFVEPTIFTDVVDGMRIAREEIFGPVIPIISYTDTDDAVRIANDTIYGLAGYVWAGNLDEARAVGRQIRAGRIYLNGAPHGKFQDVEAPFGGYKQSGNGREAGIFGMEEYLEVKALIGFEGP